MSLKIIDLCCGCGIAAVGYHRALEKKGIPHTIIGVDIKKQPAYQFEFIQADVLNLPLDLTEFDFAHYSPPCQKWVPPAKKDRHPDLITPGRQILEKSGIPYVIENVSRSPLRPDLRLVGPMFGLKSWRMRHFECSFPIAQPPMPVKSKKYISLTMPRYDNKTNHVHRFCHVPVGVIRPRNETEMQEQREALGIDWDAPYPAFTEGIPPQFTEYIMNQFLLHRKTQKITLYNYLGGARDAGA